MRTKGSPIENQVWQRLESEHRQLHAALVDVGKLAAAGSFETARKRFGTFRVSLERHLVADSKLLVLCEDNRKLEKFLHRVRRNRERILEQVERVWAQLCHEKVTYVPRMLGRLASLIVENEAAQRRLILADLPLNSERRRLHRELLLELGAI
ncbi:MAG: hypothetical protein ACXWO1_12320 [Isosphaeraceae bacterium]